MVSEDERRELDEYLRGYRDGRTMAREKLSALKAENEALREMYFRATRARGKSIKTIVFDELGAEERAE